MKTQSQSYITLGLVLITFVLSEQLYQLLFKPEPNTLLYKNVLLSQLFYLPLGVAIIVTWLHRRNAILYLIIAGLANEYLINASSVNYVTLLEIVSISLIPYLVMEFFNACGLDVYQMPDVELNKMWRTIILVTFACSFVISLFNAFINSTEGAREAAATSVIKGIIGGISGTFLSLLIIYIAFVLFNYYLQRKATK